MKRLALAFAAFVAFTAPGLTAGYSPPAEERYVPYSGILPTCDDAGVLGTVAQRFAAAESEFWASSRQIASYDRIREIGFRANDLSYIPRRYCMARAMLSDGRPRTVIYQVQESLGLIGWGYGVEWCLVGLNRNLSYAPACQALRPFLERYLYGRGAAY